MTVTYRFLGAGVVVLLTLATASCATHVSAYRSRSGLDDVAERVYRLGYEDGRHFGEADSWARRSYDSTRHRDFRNADGYLGGTRGSHRGNYRRGFVAGYRDGYRGAPATQSPARRPSRSTGWRQGPVASLAPAAQHGLRDGFERGLKDAREGKPFDPVHAPEYRSGDRQYDRRYGPRETYKLEYRGAFQEGYQRGYIGR